MFTFIFTPFTSSATVEFEIYFVLNEEVYMALMQDAPRFIEHSICLPIGGMRTLNDVDLGDVKQFVLSRNFGAFIMPPAFTRPEQTVITTQERRFFQATLNIRDFCY